MYFSVSLGLWRRTSPKKYFSIFQYIFEIGSEETHDRFHEGLELLSVFMELFFHGKADAFVEP